MLVSLTSGFAFDTHYEKLAELAITCHLEVQHFRISTSPDMSPVTRANFILTTDFLKWRTGEKSRSFLINIINDFSMEEDRRTTYNLTTSSTTIYLYTGRGGPPHAQTKCKSSGPGYTSQGRGMYNRHCGKQVLN
jgi:hypothetical protein